MKKFVSILAAIALSASLLCGCSSGQTTQTETSAETTVSETEAAVTEEETEAAEETESETEAAEADTSIVITDQAGREVVLEKPAEKVVSSYYISTAMLTALGAKDKVVGIEMKADTRELYKRACPDFLELPAVGSGKEINVEAAAALEPDLVIIPKRLVDYAASFEELNIPVIVVNPESLDQFLECVEMIGKATGCSDKAEEFCTYYKDTIAYCEDLTADAEKPSVYLCGGSSYLSTCTSEMYQSDLIKYAGGVCVSDEIEDSYWADISAEQLLAWDPDYIMPVSYAEYTIDDIKADSSLASLKAVADGNIFTVPSTIEAWDYPSPSSALGVLWMTHTLHPDLLSEDEYVEKAEDFYKTYFDIEIAREDLGL